VLSRKQKLFHFVFCQCRHYDCAEFFITPGVVHVSCISVTAGRGLLLLAIVFGCLIFSIGWTPTIADAGFARRQVEASGNLAKSALTG
jgi:hypothetical protein